MSAKRQEPKKPEQDHLPEVNDEVFKVDDTPENVAKALFKVNPNEEGFEWDYMKDVKRRQQGQDSRT